MHDSEAEVNVGQKSAQMGFTETVLNVTFFKIDMEHRSCLYILPAKTPDATEFSAARFDVALELSPHLANLFSHVKNVGHKRAGSANLYVHGSKSRSGLKSLPASFVIMDEVDEMDQNNIPLAEERSSGQPDFQIWKISTPTVPNFGINSAFLTTTQEHYVFKCYHCNRHDELVWPDSVVVVGEHENDPRITESHLICTKCKGILQHESKREWLGPDNAGWQPFGDPTFDARGFYVNQLYSIATPPHRIVKKYFQGLVDKPSEQEFFNSKLGLPHVVEGARVKDSEIDEAIGSRLKADPAPQGGVLITMGVDQGRWLHYEVDAWHVKKMGNDINMVSECEVLTEGKCVDFHELDVLMKQWQVIKCVVDAQPDRRMAYEFACRFFGHVHLCFYGRGQQKKAINKSANDDDHIITVDRTSWIDVSLNRFRTGTIQLPRDTSQEYKDHIQALIRHYSKDPSGNPVSTYVNTGADHFGHSRTYSEIALPLAASLVTNQNIRVFL